MQTCNSRGIHCISTGILYQPWRASSSFDLFCFCFYIKQKFTSSQYQYSSVAGRGVERLFSACYALARRQRQLTQTCLTGEIRPNSIHLHLFMFLLFVQAFCCGLAYPSEASHLIRYTLPNMTGHNAPGLMQSDSMTPKAHWSERKKTDSYGRLEISVSWLR